MTRPAPIVLALAALLCGGCDDNPASPSTPPRVFSAVLSPSNEVPPVGNAESTGRGAAQIAFDGSTAHFYFQLTNFQADTRIVGAHIHPAAAGVNGPVVLSTGIVSAAPVALRDGTVEFKASVAADAALVQAITANPAGYYFNVHSPLNPGGFARGQLTRVQ